MSSSNCTQPSGGGVAQGGVISPTSLNLTLMGLEDAIKTATKLRDKVNLVVYADDFVITWSTKEILENTVKPLVVSFLRVRGLELSEEKTLITHINNGFNFLGFNIRKYKQKLLIKPAKEKVKSFLDNIRGIIKTQAAIKTDKLIELLNPKIKGWANYYRHVVSKSIFSLVDKRIFQAIWKWAERRHPNKSKTWIRDKYFCTVKCDNWVFNAGVRPYKGRYKLLCLMRASSVAIKRHIKIQSKANPYDINYAEYFESRRARRGEYDLVFVGNK